MPSIRLVSVNVERSKHLDRVAAFIGKASPDIVALQECMDRDVDILKGVAGEHVLFTPLCNFYARPGEEQGTLGQAIFSRHPFKTSIQEYYAGEHDPLPPFTSDKLESIMRIARALSLVEIEKGVEIFRIATTHFTWSERGETTDVQRRDIEALFALLTKQDEFVLAGDFNAPRGGEIFTKIAEHYKDNIPPEYEWSLDEHLHRAPRSVLAEHAAQSGYTGLMVDGLFTTPGYIASEVELHSGVSDHLAVTATIRKA